MSADPDEITALLNRLRDGDETVRPEIISGLYTDMRRQAAILLRPDGQTRLDATWLVHEGLMKLLGWDKLLALQNRHQLLAVAVKIMRRVLVDYTRQRRALKRGHGMQRVPLDQLVEPWEGDGSQVDILEVDELLTRMKELYPRVAQAIELRHFGDMAVEDVAAALEISKSTAERDLRFGYAWLRRHLFREVG